MSTTEVKKVNVKQLKTNKMKTTNKKENLVNNSYQTNNLVNEELLKSHFNSIMMYWNDRDLLKGDGVKKEIEMMIEFHEKNYQDNSITRMGKKLLMEYDKPYWFDEVELEFLEKDLEDLRKGEDFWKHSMNTEGMNVNKMSYKGVTPYRTIEEYDQDVLYLIGRINKLKTNN